MQPKEAWQGPEVDLIPVPKSYYDAAYRKQNPTFVPKHALAGTWELTARNLNLLKQINKKMSRTENAVRALASAMPETVRAQVELALKSDGLDAETLARELAPMLLANQESLTQENLEAALTSIFARLGGSEE